MTRSPYVVSQNLCGVDLHSPAIRSGRSVHRRENLAEGVAAHDAIVRTSPIAVRAEFDALDPAADYDIEAVYLSEIGVRRVQVMRAGEVELHGPIELPQDAAQAVRVPVPAEAIVNGVLTVEILPVEGPDVVISRLTLYSSQPVPPVLTVVGDSRGGAVGTVATAGDEPLVGRTVRLSGPLGELVAVTDELGLFQFESLPGARNEVVELAFTVAEGDLVTTHVTDTSRLALGLRDLPGPDRRVSLDGEWQFRSGDTVATTTVPGHISFDGLIAVDGHGELSRTFDLPSEWIDGPVFIRFDAVYGAAEVFVNGIAVGAHASGATTFDVDITRAARPGRNTVSLALSEHSPHAVIDYMPWYAHMSLFGIWRDVTLFSTPGVHTVGTAITPDWDVATGIGQARLDTTVVGRPGDTYEAEAKLRDGRGTLVVEARVQGRVSERGESAVSLELEVRDAAPWSAERPTLYALELIVTSNQGRHTTAREVGFRRVEVVGSELRVNGSAIRVNGVNRHDARVLKGRALSIDDMRTDIERFREANINTIRTSHYPPHPEMIGLCDELGMYLFLQPPVTWISNDSPSRAGHSTRLLPYLFEVTGETIARDRSHSAVITWDIANESEWTPAFSAVHSWVREIDPTRATFFSFDVQKNVDWDGLGREPREKRPTIRSNHYPGWNRTWQEDLERFAELDAPLVCDEHIPIFEACQRWPHELYAVQIDPGVRDYWVTEVAPYLRALAATPNCIGGMVWSGVDDTFALPFDNHVGMGDWEYLREGNPQPYDLLTTSDDVHFRGDGEWGVLDGWGRPRAEHWHLAKMYSPVEVTGEGLTAAGLAVEVHNRFSHLDLAETSTTLIVDGETREIELVAAPGQTARLRADLDDARDVRLELRHPGGWLVDGYAWQRPATPLADEVLAAAGRPTLDEAAAVSGADDRAWLTSLPAFHVQSADTPHLALEHPVPGGTWSVSGSSASLSVSAEHWTGVITIDAHDDRLTYAYTLEYHADEQFNAREVGLEFSVSPELCDLWWSRNGEWSYYPPTHIGRTDGYASPAAAPYDRLQPAATWEQDTSEWGSVDYRSAKRSIRAAGLTDGTRSVTVLPDGEQSVRAWIDDGRPVLAVLDWYGGVRTFDPQHRVWSSYFGPGQVFSRGTVVKGAGSIVLGGLPASRRQ